MQVEVLSKKRYVFFHIFFREILHYLHTNTFSVKLQAAKYSFPLPLIPPGFDPCTFSAAMARSILTSPFHPHDSNFIPLTPPAVAVSTSGASVGRKQVF